MGVSRQKSKPSSVMNGFNECVWLKLLSEILYLQSPINQPFVECVTVYELHLVCQLEDLLILA